MLQLRRVLLESIGHPNARFAPLELDLTDEQRRPTHTVVWLRNGGGKSSLLNLVFAVVRPHRREFLGGNDDGKDRRLADYVLDGDTGHVCIEWGRPGARQPLLVTGMALEWRDRTRVADESRLRRLWYAFVPSDHREPGLLADEPTLTFDTVPRSEDGRRLSLSRFRDRLRALGSADPTLRLVTPASQAEWRRELEQHDLDPEVLRYQLRMNQEEGGASELFKRRCRTASDFVDLLLELAVADERTDRVADVYSRYADELARRPDIERNREFLAGALERLEPLAGIDAEHAAATAGLQGVLATASGTASALRSLASQIRTRATDEQATAADRRRAADRAAAREGELRRQQRSLQRRATDLDIDTSQRLHDDTQVALASAEARLAAATLADPLARRATLDAEIAALDEQLDADPSQTAQQLARTRVWLVRRLRTDLDRSAAAAADEQDKAARRQQEAERAGADARRATADGGRLEQLHATLVERREAWLERYAELRSRQIVGDGEEVAVALARTTTALDTARREREDHRRRAAALDDDVRAAYGRLSSLDAALGEARARTSTREHELTQMHADAATLAADTRLREVAETDEIDLWHTGDGLADRLDTLVANADRALADGAVAEAADRAALVALQTEGLLPPRAATTEVVAALREHGIDAVPGWHHLAERVSSAERAELLARIPALIDGVVVSDPSALDSARDAIGDLREPLRSAVVIGAASTAPAATPQLVAPVDPALYDRSHADHARDRLQHRLADADRGRAALIAARDHDATLADRLRRVLRTYPSQHRRSLDEDARLARGDEQRLRAERDAAETLLAQLESQRGKPADVSDDHLPQLSAAVTALTALHDAHVDPSAIAALASDAAAAQTRAATLSVRVDDLRRASATHLLTAQRHKDDRDRLRDELAALAQGDDDGDAANDDDDPGLSADALRQRLRVLQIDVDAERSDHALAERRRLLAEQRAELERDLASAAPEALRRARELLDSADGRDRRSRVAARDVALSDRDAALAARAEAAERLRAARAAADLLVPQEELDDAERADVADDVTTAAQARRRAEDLARAADSLRSDSVRALADAAEADRRAGEQQQHADRFDHLAELLTIELRARPTSGRTTANDDGAHDVTVPADPQRARATVGELRRRIEAHAAGAERASRAVSAAAAEVRRFVTDDRFAVLDGPIRARLSGDPVAVVRDGTALLDQLHIRLTQCDQKLDELASHRRLLVREIAADAQRGLWLLRQADHVSSLPDGFGAWSDERFLQIRFATPAADHELDERLSAMVDRLVDDGIRPAGVPLLQQAVHAAVGTQGFTVQILKPNPALTPARVPVTELATFSGGEQLTAAILLYCTLARLRAQARQTEAAAGVLTLDNPIGKSSNVTLLQLQRRVADAMGVQLIYTTAVDDREAVGVLPHWIRLRNERRDSRSGNLHVERVADAADGGQHGTVDATRMWRRADAALPAAEGG